MDERLSSDKQAGVHGGPCEAQFVKQTLQSYSSNMPRKKKEEEPKPDDNDEEPEESAGEEEEPEASAGEEEESTDKGKRSTRGAGRNDGKWRKLGK